MCEINILALPRLGPCSTHLETQRTKKESFVKKGTVKAGFSAWKLGSQFVR